MIFFAIIYMSFFLIIFILLVMDLRLIAACMMTAKRRVASPKRCTAVYNTLLILSFIRTIVQVNYQECAPILLANAAPRRVMSCFNFLLWPLFKSIRRLIVRGVLV